MWMMLGPEGVFSLKNSFGVGWVAFAVRVDLKKLAVFVGDFTRVRRLCFIWGSGQLDLQWLESAFGGPNCASEICREVEYLALLRAT